ncbi:uncharacterized protein LOC111296284 [Durio zibethinus]|uniref:Uncharacterized protein LOC111296284 n=1 Tax=Durio zibethinus TaxID=66656 RepID=A0A6P5Z114_DURZI|nr:uncharacterized protein LOC111296284 [Durio zibethinus]
MKIEGQKGRIPLCALNQFKELLFPMKELLGDKKEHSKYMLGELVMCQENLVQKAVDTLLDNGIHGQSIRDGHNKVYKLFSEFTKGKEGTFRETCLANEFIIWDVLSLLLVPHFHYIAVNCLVK